MPTNYEPSDDVHVFDGGDDDDDVEGSRLPLLIVIALLVLAAFGGVVWLAYQRGVQQGHAEVPRVIAAEPGPVKVPPESAGGTATPYTGLKIYQQPAPSNEEAESDTATPVQPAVESPVKAAPAPAATPAPAPVSVTPKEAPKTTPPLKVVAAPPAPPKVVAPAPAKSAAVSVTPAAVKEPKKAVSAPPAPVAAAPVATQEVNAAAAGSGLLQIGSYKSAADANAASNTYRAKHAALLASLSFNVVQVDLGDKGVWYRLRIVAGDKASAASLCDKLKAEGGVCIPVR